MLSGIPWDQNIKAEAVEAFFKAAVKGPDTLMEVYACHEKAISSLILESPPAWNTVTDWVQAQKADPAINQIITLLEDKKLDTVKVGKEMSQDLKQYLRQKWQVCLWEGVLCWCGSQAQWNHNELQVVVQPEYRFEAMCGAHDDVGHLGLEWMLDILCNRFYWPNLEANTISHVHTCKQCLRFKSKQDKAELYPLLATYPLELIHMDILKIENPHTGADVIILAITDHFTWYAKAVITSNQSAKATAIAFWNEFIANYDFPEKLLTNQGCNFESQLVKELFKLAQIWKVQTTPYHLETNGQCKRFKQTLMNMISMLETKDKQHWKDYLPTLVQKCNCTKNNATDFSPYYLMYGCKPRLPIDIQFGLNSCNKFLAKLSTQLWWCYKLADQHQYKESTCQKQWYDKKMRASRLEPSDLCQVWQKAFGGKHKKGDCWENMKSVVVEQQLNLPVYTIKLWQGVGRTQVVHQNLLTHIMPHHRWDEMQSESEPGDEGSSGSMPSTTGPVTQSQTRAHQLAQSIQDAWIKAVQYTQCK